MFRKVFTRKSRKFKKFKKLRQKLTTCKLCRKSQKEKDERKLKFADFKSLVFEKIEVFYKSGFQDVLSFGKEFFVRNK